MKTKWKGSQLYEGDWTKICNPYYLGCCDCGLIHKLVFRIGKMGHIEYQVYRHEEFTKAARKKAKRAKKYPIYLKTLNHPPAT